MTAATPAHDAPKPARTYPEKKYPAQLVIMVPDPVAELVRDLAAREGLHKSEVLRSLLNAGIRKAGYGDVLDTDKREKPLHELAPETSSD